MKTFRKTFGITSLAFALLSVSPGSLAQEPEAVVELATVSERSSSAVIRLPGTVISKADADIAAELSGRLTWVAEVGDEVEKGDTLAVIDDHLLQLQSRNDSAEIARITADIRYTERQIKRLESLAQKNNTAQSELDQIQSRLEMMNQDLRIAEVALDRTRYDLKRTRVTAPFAGIIASRQMDVGEFTEPGESLLRVVDTQSLEISVSAPLRVARFNRRGSQVQVEADERHAISPIRGVIPVGDERSRMMEVRIALEPGNWYIGEAVTVELADGMAHNTLSIPRDALVLRNDQVFVYTISSDNTAVKIPVTPGAGFGPHIAITGELESGDPVVIRGAERLSEGQAVKVIQHHLAIY